MGILAVPVPPPTLMVMGTLAAGATSQGTWKVSCCTPFRLATLEMGAATLFTATESVARVVAHGPKALLFSTVPMILGANPEAVTVTRLQGDRAVNRAPPPALKKLLPVRAGPGGITVRVKIWEMRPMTAVTVTAPGVAPAVTGTCARPWPSVCAEPTERVALPVGTKLTTWPDKGWPLVPLTCTTRGAANGCPDWVVCCSPDTFAREAIWTLVERVKVAEMPL